jgi:translation initiation factor 2 subunit 1
MFLKKQDFPEEGELVLCTVTKIFGHAVFVSVDEYSKNGMINISEVAPGRIRNLRDFVVEGKKIVCAVLRVNKEKGHIDLSLRRVNDNQKRKKLEQIQLEQKAEKIIEFVAKEMEIAPEQLYKEVMSKVKAEYTTLNSCFSAIVNDNIKLSSFGIREDFAEKIAEVVKDRMKPVKIIISGDLSIKVLTPNGVEAIRDALKKAEDIGKDAMEIRYLGGGTYHLVITAADYKKGEKILKDALEAATKIIAASKGEISFKRKED